MYLPQCKIIPSYFFMNFAFWQGNITGKTGSPTVCTVCVHCACVRACVCVLAPYGVSDVLLVSSTRRDYRLRREDVPENVPLLLCEERPSADQRESLARDLSVSHIAMLFAALPAKDVYSRKKYMILNIYVLSPCSVYCRKHRDASLDGPKGNMIF